MMAIVLCLEPPASPKETPSEAAAFAPAQLLAPSPLLLQLLSSPQPPTLATPGGVPGDKDTSKSSTPGT